MSTGYTLLNGLAVAFGFVMAVVSLVLYTTGNPASHLLIISLLVIVIGLQGWQYIQTLVRIDELKDQLKQLNH